MKVWANVSALGLAGPARPGQLEFAVRGGMW
jgi:hypothetical protein